MEQLIEIMINIIKKSALPFIVSTMLLIIIGSFIGKDMSTISTLCTPQGIPFTSLFQLMGLSIIIGIINTIFDLSNTLKTRAAGCLPISRWTAPVGKQSW